ncbi:MAG: hypothetical protein D0531_07105 [Methylococcales bacterium]|nr:MAG: hypothetical protein D0531_07105 [Methylococcales bacterium]
MTRFTEDLATTLTLTISGKTYSIPEGNVKSLALDLYPYGYQGEVSFVVDSEKSKDTLLAPLTTNDLIEVSLTVATYVNNTQGTLTPLSLKGLVTSRYFTEQLLHLPAGKDIMLLRHYHLVFADPAQVLWKQHYPCDLLVDSTLKALITAHTPTQITMVYNWDAVLSVHYPVLSLSLGTAINQASFYDYLIWLVDTYNGVFSYDYATHKYTLSAAKIKSGTALSLDHEEVAGYIVDYPEVHRFQPNVLNAYSENPQTTAITNAAVTTKIRRDYIASYPIAADMQARVTLETARFKQHLHEVRLEYQHFQLQVTPPGKLVNFKGSILWNKLLYIQAKNYRVKEWHLNAQVTEQELTMDMNMAYSHYDMECNLTLESVLETFVPLPTYTLPSYPVFVEGKIVSEKGADDDMTYQFYTDSDTSANYYKVSIPLWTKQKVRADYQPNQDGGQFYFPPYKNARVLIRLEFNRAYIESFLDWGTGTALPLDSQGNQLVMGTSATSQNIIKHNYVDSKPELQIQRTQDKDVELLQFSDGYILLQTQQDK